MNVEDQVVELMKQSADTMPSRPAVLIGGARERGRALQRRRRRLQLLSGVGLTGLVAVVAVAVAVSVSSGGAAGRRPDRADGHGPVVAVHPSSSSPIRASTAPRSSPAAPASRAGRLLAATIALLPRPGTTSDPVLQDTATFVSAAFVYNDGAGAALVTVDVKGTPLKTGHPQSCTAGDVDNAPGGAQGTCRPLAGGAIVITYQASVDGPDNGVKDWRADVYRADGVVVGIDAVNAPKIIGAPPSRTDPPFTVEQLAAIAENPALTK